MDDAAPETGPNNVRMFPDRTGGNGVRIAIVCISRDPFNHPELYPEYEELRRDVARANRRNT